MSLDSKKLKQINADMLKALEAVAKKHNVSFSGAGGKFTEDSATLKIKVTLNSETGEKVFFAEEAASFKRNAARYGLKPSDLGKSFISGNQAFYIVGLKTSRPKYPIIAQTKEQFGKTSAAYKFSAKCPSWPNYGIKKV